MTTTTADKFLQKVLNEANPNLLATALRMIRLGNMFGTVKVAFVVTAAASVDITTLASKNGATISGLDRETQDLLPPIGSVKTLRVTASGTANTVGAYAVGDVAATMLSPLASTVVGLARISDDGKTLTFPTSVTEFVLEYVPQPAVPLATTKWPVGV